ncbi:hypothetical protein U2F26_07305 [Micromonospora sp. 4G57]|uniref:Bacterial Ig-like domain-containing protein n=1 Tax=Micromonospora sicca TaxID=2202420 RepID=A0ABU5JDP5_9ACTN|nr:MULTISPECIES: hypothetical protein [unclassified Micromonospora]MDZ5442538.1 hypothetical protein [Micromonospora sp. 4G57]MDZ5490710.1 hypothetical protein [Micromonospora sp. 4G53]
MSRATGHAQLDAVPLPLATIGTPTPFEVRGALGNGVTSTPRATPVSVWGLWACLPPLAPGAHELAFGGSDGGGFWVEQRLAVASLSRAVHNWLSWVACIGSASSPSGWAAR